jgi:hypothetical protein
MTDKGLSANDLAAKLALIVDYAPRIRAAGVSSLTIGEISMDLLAPEPKAIAHADEDKVLPLDRDPETYGLPEGADIPGFRRPEGKA